MQDPDSSSSVQQGQKNYLALAGWITLVLGLGSGIGIFFGPDEWFQTIAKPTWNPPGWLFGPVWTVLYIMVGISVWLIQQRRDVSSAAKASAMRLFWIQLVLNLAWTPIFFGLHSPALAFVLICALWITIVLTISAFGKISTWAGYLLIPYLAWVSFALILNGTIWLMNA
jgi:translocator protein